MLGQPRERECQYGVRSTKIHNSSIQLRSSTCKDCPEYPSDMHQLLLELLGPVKNDRSSMPISFGRLSYCLLGMELEKLQQYGEVS
jgi:hypothetical protein